jgi:hypothetical protein
VCIATTPIDVACRDERAAQRARIKFPGSASRATRDLRAQLINTDEIRTYATSSASRNTHHVNAMAEFLALRGTVDTRRACRFTIENFFWDFSSRRRFAHSI